MSVKEIGFSFRMLRLRYMFCFFEGTRCICPRTLFLQKNKIFTISPVRDGAWKIFYILLLISMLQIIGIRCGFHARKMEIPCR